MKATNYILLILVTVVFFGCQNEEIKSATASSLSKKEPIQQVAEINSDSADQYTLMLHHGPAIENEYFGLRLYFNNSGAIDVYSKQNKQLELAEAMWYPDSLQQAQGFGSDQYKVGKTTGLGGIKLWDGEQALNLIATKGRTARVSTDSVSSTMEMIAKGVIYKADTIDVAIKVTVWGGDRWARVEASVSGEHDVEFATGVNYHPTHTTFQEDGLIGTWGVHPEDVALDPGELGAAMRYNEDDFSKFIKTEDQLLLISKPAKELYTLIISVSEKEAEINTLERFKKYTY